MASLKEAIYAILSTDAADSSVGHLGHSSLIGKASAAPYGVYFSSPPETPDVPYLTYFVSSISGELPRDVFIAITAWGNTYEDILGRVRDLLHDAQVTADDITVLRVLQEGSGPELWDNDLKCYYRQDRYQVIGAKL